MCLLVRVIVGLQKIPRAFLLAQQLDIRSVGQVLVATIHGDDGPFVATCASQDEIPCFSENQRGKKVKLYPTK